jgi:ATP-dependent Lhr-like helicase
LPEAVESLRASRARDCLEPITVSAADPLNLAGILTTGERVPAIPGREVRYLNGSILSDSPPAESESGVPASKVSLSRIAAAASTDAVIAANPATLF